VIRRAVAIGGPPGSGKSTAGRRVAAALGLEYCSAGERFREEARARGMTLEAYGEYARAHPEVDRELDRYMQGRAKPGLLLDGRIQGALCRRHDVAVYALAVTASEEVRVARLAGRDGVSPERAREELRRREASERARYLAFYGIDLDSEPADLTIDSSALPADRVAEMIVQFLTAAEARTGP
jgi:CMP/dCMP kinase